MSSRSHSKPFSCISCGASFSRNGDLSSHLAQAAKCHWVIQKREAIEAAKSHDYRELSDGEDDPPAEMDFTIPYEDMDALADDIMSDVELGDTRNTGEFDTSASVGPENCRPYIEDIPDIDEPSHPDDGDRGRAEDDLDHEYVCYQDYSGAGKVYDAQGHGHEAFSLPGHQKANIYHPFSSQLDWEIARWANEDGPGQAAFTRLLEIDGVRFAIP